MLQLFRCAHVHNNRHQTYSYREPQRQLSPVTRTFKRRKPQEDQRKSNTDWRILNFGANEKEHRYEEQRQPLGCWLLLTSKSQAECKRQQHKYHRYGFTKQGVEIGQIANIIEYE